MQLNQFIWNNYKESKAGQEVIKLFEEGTFEDILQFVFTDKRNWNMTDLYSEELSKLAKVTIDPNPVLSDDDNVKYFFNLLEEFGFPELENEEIIGYTYPDQKMEIINRIEIISLWLFLTHPNLFVPYLFKNRLSDLFKIADNFNIELPEIPLRKEKDKRIAYYFSFCEIFKNFGKENNLNPYELCAFLYDFAPKFLGRESEILPEPTNIWLCGGAKDDYPFLLNASSENIYSWQGNEDTKKGDIIVMYCLSPRSNIEFICRAVNDGIRDPFFHYYGSISVGHIQKVEPIHISELKSDEHFKELPIVRKNLQGVNGTQINNEDYQRILKILSEKGQDISILPKLSSVDFKPNSDCKNEREVEIKIVEPFLNQIGYTESDWIRQLPVRMGRGERNYPDYVFFAETKKGYEKAKMLLETKFIIKSNRELEETFQQAHSYALRLSSEIIVISDKDYFWIYLRESGSFDRTKYIKHNWQELNNADIFNKIKKIIGKEFLK